jgi:tetratricopeptide (TPR) repeat protein
MGVAQIGLGMLNLRQGEFEQAGEYAQAVLTMSDPPADILRQLQAQHLLITIALKTGVNQAHFDSMENILGFTRYIGAQPYCVQALLTLAEMYLLCNEVAQAEAMAEEARQLAEICQMRLERCTALRILAEIKAQQGDLDAAGTLVDKALTLARAIQAPLELALCLRTRAGFSTQLRGSVDDLNHALSLFEGLEAHYEAAQTRQIAGKGPDERFQRGGSVQAS